MGRLSTWLVIASLSFIAMPLSAQNEPIDEGEASAVAPASEARPWMNRVEKPDQKYYYLGAAWRLATLPSGLAKMYTVETEATLFMPGNLFIEGGIRKNGRQLGVNIGFLKLGFEDAFRTKKDPLVDTEWLNADFSFLVTTMNLTWSTAFKDWVQLEYGFEAGFAFMFGSMVRNEAVLVNGKWRKCETWADNEEGGWDNPDNRYPNPRPSRTEQEYCAVPLGGDEPPATNAADEDGEHYNVKSKRGLFNQGVPYVLPVLAPRLSLRFKPMKPLVIRVDIPLPSLPFGLVGGIAVQYGF